MLTRLTYLLERFPLTIALRCALVLLADRLRGEPARPLRGRALEAAKR
jgi:hypothetical protein